MSVNVIDCPFNKTERANITACAMGISLNINYDPHGAGDHIVAMYGADIVFNGCADEAVAYICGLNSKVNMVLSLFAAEGIDYQNRDQCLTSLLETCAPTQLSRLYLYWILGNESLIRYLRSDCC